MTGHVELSKIAKKCLRKIPGRIVRKFKMWLEAVEVDGIREVRKIKSYQSDSLGYKDLDKLISICEKGFKEEINNDLEIPGALAYLFDFIKQINILLSEEKLSNQDAQLILEFIEKIDSILGILKEEEIPNKITKLAAERVIARENKDWKKSDELRDKIKQLGYQVDDSKKKIIIKKI